MTNELNDLVPAQEKLEWVTPKISLMVAGDTERKRERHFQEGVGDNRYRFGPS